MSGKAVIQVTREALRDALHLPKDVSVSAVHQWSPFDDVIHVVLHGPNLPEVAEATLIPTLETLYVKYPKEHELQAAGWETWLPGGHDSHGYWVKDGHEKIPTEWVQAHTTAEVKKRAGIK